MVRLYEEIVGRGGVSPTHFFYEMTFPEAAAFMRGLQLREREEWERARGIMWAAIMPHSKKKLEYQDIMKFPWETESLKDDKPDEKDIERIKEIAKKIKL